MRVTAIEFAGAAKKTAKDPVGMPQAFARVTRRQDNVIEIVTITPDRTRTRTLRADCDESALFYRAQELQEILDGHVGTNSDINDYFRELQRLAD